MLEHQFRIILGLTIILALYFDIKELMLGLMVIMAFEAITNWRIPILVSCLRHPKETTDREYLAGGCGKYITGLKIEAERILRVIIIVLIAPSYFYFFDYAWFVPWFVAFALLGAGLSNICPLVILLKRLGFR